jgi:transcriptional regulator with XRE-family HTH domain
MREDRGKTQLEIELDANLGIGYLQRVEAGKVRYPERDTLERILAALGAHYTERRDVLELFGYVVSTPLPDEGDMRWAARTCRVILDSAVFPAYLLDCGHRLLAWNALVPQLFEAVPRLWAGERPSMLRMLFDPACQLTALIANAGAFFPAQIRALRYEMRLFRGEPWYAALLQEMRAYPLFERYWAATATDQQADYVAGRPLVPLELNLPGTGPLRFRITSEPFALDWRFRIIYYLPADPVTMQQCVLWLQASATPS